MSKAKSPRTDKQTKITPVQAVEDWFECARFVSFVKLCEKNGRDPRVELSNGKDMPPDYVPTALKKAMTLLRSLTKIIEPHAAIANVDTAPLWDFGTNREKPHAQHATTIKQLRIRLKPARLKNISGWSGKFIVYANRVLKGAEPQYGDIVKIADKFLALNPACRRKRSTLEGAWRKHQSGAKAAR